MLIYNSRDSSVGVALGYGLDDRGSRVRFSAGAGNFSLHHRVQKATQNPIQWVPGALSLVVKWPGHEADHSLPPNAEVKECVELYLHSPNTPSWRGAQLKKAQGQLYLYLYLYNNMNSAHGLKYSTYVHKVRGPSSNSIGVFLGGRKLLLTLRFCVKFTGHNHKGLHRRHVHSR
jgi:hypothetical protein